MLVWLVMGERHRHVPALICAHQQHAVGLAGCCFPPRAQQRFHLHDRGSTLGMLRGAASAGQQVSRQRSPAAEQTKHTRWVIYTSGSLSSVLAFCALDGVLAKPSALHMGFLVHAQKQK